MLAVVGFFIIQGQNQPAAPPPAEGEDGVAAPEGQEGQVAPTPVPQDTVGVVVSLQTLPRGHVITEDIITIDRRPSETLEGNVITQTQDVIGKFARTDIYQGQTLTSDKLATDIREIGEELIGPSSLIPPGFVAQSVPLRTFLDVNGQIASVGFGIAEGDYVDVLILLAMHEIDEEFQTYLPNDAKFFIEEFNESEDDPENEELAGVRIFTISPFGRFEELPTGDLAHISQQERSREFIIGMIIQNAKVIQVGQYIPPPPAVSRLATPTPTPVPEGEPTPTPIASGPTATPLPPDVITLALQPQQQLLLRYAIETGADIDLALRGVNDGQLYSVENVDLSFLLERFDIELPPNFGYSIDNGQPLFDLQITPTPVPLGVPEGGGPGPSGEGS